MSGLSTFEKPPPPPPTATTTATTTTAAPANADTDAVDAAVFRKVLGRVPTAVSVVTAEGADGPVGVTVGSFTSVSLDPPLVVFFCGLHSASAAAIAAAGRFCVNVLAEDQQHTSAAFAGRADDRFTSRAFEAAANGAPRIPDAVAWIECDVEATFPVGDHLAITGRVRRLTAAASDRRPLLFYSGRLVRLDGAVARHAPTHRLAWWGP